MWNGGQGPVNFPQKVTVKMKIKLFRKENRLRQIAENVPIYTFGWLHRLAISNE